MDNDSILNALKSVKDPDLNRDIVALGFIKNLRVCDGNASFDIELTTPACPVREQMKEQARVAVMALPGMKKVEIKMTSQVRSSPGQAKVALIPGVKNIIPVASGKGGVGKSTVSANLALALAGTGASVGLMDADVYGPSIPLILGMNTIPVREGQQMKPAEQYGIKIMSMGFFAQQNEATIWRGPMLHKIVEQFLGGVLWGELDYLIVDLPPGTGDIQLSLCQMIPLTGAAVVSTPQDVALKVATKAIAMFNKLNTPILGMIENMSHYECPKCGNRDEVFGTGGARAAALELGIPFLGEIPLSTRIRTTSDAGKPIVISEPDSPYSAAFVAIAKNLAAQISIRNIRGENVPIKISF